jgi:hypothetical protein
MTPPIPSAASGTPGTPASRAVELQIEELVLHGFAPEDGPLLGAVVERELARLLAAEGGPPSLARGGVVARLDGGAFEVAAGATADAIGAQVAQAIYRGLGQ